jgi:hypothetical protein
METTCYRCHAAIQFDGKIGRRDSCQSCGVSLHACKFCLFYDPKSYNECRETSADRVVDKEKENYCDYFQMSTQSKNPTGDQAKEQAKKKLDDLFK